MEKPSFFPSTFQPSRPISSFSFFLSFYRGPNSLSAQPFSLPRTISVRRPVLRLLSLPSHCQQAPPVVGFFLPCTGRTLAKPESGSATSSPALALTPRRPAAPINSARRPP